MVHALLCPGGAVNDGGRKVDFNRDWVQLLSDRKCQIVPALFALTEKCMIDYKFSFRGSNT